MLDRVAMHQTRLRTPGLGLDPKGVALGARGLVLLPSLDRLVTFLALYTRSASLADLLGSLAIEVVRSKLGSREVTVGFAVEGSERLDRVAEVARLAGGFVFTGTKRHFVQYRDAGAPFGYDVQKIEPTDATLALYHTTFSQNYEPERRVDLATLVLRLQPAPAPETVRADGPRWICAEAGLGPALIEYFVRSQVAADVAVAEWPPVSEFEPTPVRRYLFRVAELPARMVPLFSKTPGIALFAPAGESAAVELGYRHPVELRACPVFPQGGLALLRGGGQEPLLVERLPTFGPVASFARMVVGDVATPPAAARAASVAAIDVPLRLMPDTSPWRQVTAALIGPNDLPMLRELCYRLARHTLAETTVAFTAWGALLRREAGIEAMPIGELFSAVHPRVYVSAGHSHVPTVAPDVLFRSLGSPPDMLLFLTRDGQRLGVAESAFVPLEHALLESTSWRNVTAEPIAPLLATPLPVVELESPGFRPLRDFPDGGGGETGGAGQP